ncbi:uncharacterized protein [Macrobrachium rosenbergii]|uniref:uncharacterized protein n=1 Tax=Macrobrachium rosenbergii TaxID=79674 RepID=UPI0034D7A012
MATHNLEANGMLELFHHSWKAVLTPQCQDRMWKKELLWILLGLRKVPHAALNTSPAEALCGQSLATPANVSQTLTELTTPSDVSRALKQIMPDKTTYNTARKVHFPKELGQTKYAFVRTDAHRHPLSHIYSGPHRVLQQRGKCYQMSVDGSMTWVSIDRLKPAYIFIGSIAGMTSTRSNHAPQVMWHAVHQLYKVLSRYPVQFFQESLT